MDAFRLFRINGIFGQGHAIGNIHGVVIGFHRSFRNHAVLHIQINGLLDIFSAVGNYYHIAPAEGGVVKLTQLLNQSRSAGFVRHDIALVFSQGSAVFSVEDHIIFLCSILRRKGIGRISVKYVPGVVIHSVRIGEYIAVTQLDAFCGLFRLVVIPTGSGRFLISSRGGIHRFFFCRRLRNGSALVGHHALISHHVLQISSGSGFGHAAELHIVPHQLFQAGLVAVHQHHIFMLRGHTAVQICHLLSTGHIRRPVTLVLRHSFTVFHIEDFVHFYHMAALLVDNGHGAGIAVPVKHIPRVKIQSRGIGKGITVTDL